MPEGWQFWIDVGGTFTDCIARAPDGTLSVCKTLSSGVTQGTVARISDDRLHDPLRAPDPEGFWTGYTIRFLNRAGEEFSQNQVTGFSPTTGIAVADAIPRVVQAGDRYEMSSGEEAPLVAIRRLLQLSLDDPLPPVTVRLGTTRGTNALLERKGARAAFVTTRGFADVLLIGNQDRPCLFDLAIKKPEPLFCEVVEIDERLDADGRVIRPVDPVAIRVQLAELKQTGVDSLAICLLHAYCNSAHEEIVATLARESGFAEISTSSAVAPRIKLVSRGDTTVLDAYLNPVLRRYVDGIRQSLGPASLLKVMTSAGGLVDADSFRGCESIVSGPAGGVVGFANVAQRAGFERAIGFDMGGTSTDVSRFDGRYEMDFETQKAGVRIMTPTLAIETVAAGGGSLCQFDGVTLSVGPESAGADPGPACYGRGGPLTVTDVNLFLGRIPAGEFPFSLDGDAVERHLAAMCEQIADSPLGRQYTPVKLAAGFVEIANANMVRAIRRISVAKGYDPADYVLVTFGGAGGQHACAIARQLGIRQILVHPFAGILSAYGIGLADVRRHREAPVLRRLDADTLTGLESTFAGLEHATVAEVEADGIPRSQIEPPLRSLDLRYEGVEGALTISQPENGDYRAAYEALHEQMFGYRRDGRPIEVVAARVEALGRTSQDDTPEQPTTHRLPEPATTANVVFGDDVMAAGIFYRRDLRPGDELTGPAILCEPTSTVVVDPEFSASVTATGNVLLKDTRRAEDAGPPVRSNDRSTSIDQGKPDQRSTDQGTNVPRSPDDRCASVDPVRLEIFNNQFASIAEQMGVTLQKTALSTNVKERLDFSCAVFDAQGGLVVNAPHIPVHLGAMSETVRRVLEDNPGLNPGEVIVTNDPYRGGSHLPDVTVVTPMHDIEGKLQFVTASRAHHAEIGGITPGSMPPFSKNLGEEGILIRNFRLIESTPAARSSRGACNQRAGSSGSSAANVSAAVATTYHRGDELRKLLTAGPFPSRSPDDNLADIAAQVAANQAGVRLLRELIQRSGRDVVQDYMGHIQDAAAAKMRLALAQLDAGTRTFTDQLDDGSPICIAITTAGDRASVDFTGTGPVLASNLNANRAIVTAAVMYVFRCLIAEDIPLNSGVLEPIEIVLPECLLNPPEHEDPQQCAAMVGGNVETSQRVVDVLLGALGVAAASQGTMNNLTFGDETFGYYETICGGSGATLSADGADAVHTHMTNTRLTDVEVIERRYPVRVEEFAIRKNSGGQGRHAGGDGIVRRIRFLKPLKVSLLTQRRGPYPPFGLSGGQPGSVGRNLLQRTGTDDMVDLGGCGQIEVAPGDLLTIETPGGGGYG